MGIFYIFIDENQALYPRQSNLPVSNGPFYLTNNCRNTVPIHLVGYTFYEGNSIDLPELVGPDVVWTTADKPDAQADAVVRRVNQWVHIEGLRPEDVVVLIANRPKAFAYELLEKRADVAGVEWAIEAHGEERCVLVDTVARFKGLEAQAVVLWMGDEVVEEKQWETVYVGTTRAKSILAIVGTHKALRTLRERRR